ncbi:MAG TPA: hypothetical protein VHC44_02010, partial [Verrucomicrobiae bacterium]|nr:hypothetical protein [Verrucomicrobiae bacterium]
SRELPPAWSLYSSRRLRQLFARGTLFAWHLYLESVPVWPRARTHFLKKIGPPAPYGGARREIADLQKILRSAVAELERKTPSVVYELGLIALACRDTAMAASPKLTGRFDFSRHAPLVLPTARFPLTRRQFDYLLSCRRATTRGGEFFRNIRIEQQVKARSTALCEWSARILDRIAHE